MSTKKIALFVAGFALVIVGVAMTLKYWVFLKMLLTWLAGPVLAVAGLVVLVMTRD